MPESRGDLRGAGQRGQSFSHLNPNSQAKSYSLSGGENRTHRGVSREGAFMKRFWTAVAVAGFAFGLLAGCNDYNNSIQYNTGATLTNVAPSGLPAGAGRFC